MKNRRLVVLLSLTLVVSIELIQWQSGASVQAKGQISTGKIVTTGQAELTAAPDTATVVVGASILASTATDAQAELAKRLNAIRQALADLQIPENAVQTRNFSVGPEYEYDKDGKQTLRGYRASHDLTVQVAEVLKLGQVLDTVVNAGATQVRDVQFGLKDNKALVHEALKQAVADAKNRADALAAGAGVKVVRLTRIQDQSTTVTPMRATLAVAKAYAEDTSVAAGEVVVRANVEIECEFK